MRFLRLLEMQKKQAKQGEPESLGNEWVPLWVPHQETEIANR